MKKHSAEKECYFLASLALTVIANAISYQGSRLFTHGRLHHSVALPLDYEIPLLPWTISIYLGCIVFWVLLYRRAAWLPREKADRFFCANLLGKAVCLGFFLFFPTAYVRPGIAGTGMWESFMRLLYRIDAPDNLFPSLHCMIGWLCWVGVRGNRQVSLAWRLSALIMAVLVCLSTLTTRQHLILDVFGGVLLSEICYALSALGALRGAYARLAGRLTERLLALWERARRKRGSPPHGPLSGS